MPLGVAAHGSKRVLSVASVYVQVCDVSELEIAILTKKYPWLVNVSVLYSKDKKIHRHHGAVHAPLVSVTDTMLTERTHWYIPSALVG